MNNKQKEKILENVKLKISISNFEKEEKIEMKKTRKSIFKIVAIACCTMLSITGVVFAKDIGNFVKEFFGGNASEGVDTAVNNGYVAEVKTEYQSADGIDIAIDSFMMDDNNFAMNFRIKLSDKYNVKDMMFGMRLYDLKIVDENGRKVFATHELEGEEMSIYKTEQEAKENYDAFCGSYGANSEIIGENEIIRHLSARQGGNPFPKSKKLYVTFTRIHVTKDQNEQPLDKWYKGDWKFELDVPKEMYNREITTYKVKSCSIENTIVDNAILSNTSFRISIPFIKTDKVDYELYRTSNPKSIYDKMLFQKEYVETSDGKRFEVSRNGQNGYGVPAGTEQIEDYTQTFDLTKYDETDELTVHIFTNKGEEIIIEYEKIK